MLAKALLWWPAATTISGFIIAAVAVVAGTISISLGILVLITSAVLWTPTFSVLWSMADPTASWTYFNKSGLGNNFHHSPAEQVIYIWPSIKGIAVWGTVNSWAGKRPITLCKTDADVEMAIAAGSSVATEWRPTVATSSVGIPIVPVFVSGDAVPAWQASLEALQQPIPKCRITYGPPLKLTVREAKRAATIWSEHIALAAALCIREKSRQPSKCHAELGRLHSNALNAD